MMSKPSKDFNIAIIGDGMSGLAWCVNIFAALVRSCPFTILHTGSAARLLQDGLDVTVFEAAVSRTRSVRF